MNIAIILAGGCGSRIASDIPKQFIELSGQMMITHSIRPVAESKLVDNYQIVADSRWREKIENELFEALEKHDGAMPVLPMKDTVYFSRSGKKVDELLNRNCIYAGQALDVNLRDN